MTAATTASSSGASGNHSKSMFHFPRGLLRRFGGGGTTSSHHSEVETETEDLTSDEGSNDCKKPKYLQSPLRTTKAKQTSRKNVFDYNYHDRNIQGEDEAEGEDEGEEQSEIEFYQHASPSQEEADANSRESGVQGGASAMSYPTTISHTSKATASANLCDTNNLVILELQSSIDFLTTKLQQSESQVRALLDQNAQLEAVVESQRKHQQVLTGLKSKSGSSDEETIQYSAIELQMKSSMTVSNQSVMMMNPMYTCDDANHKLTDQYQAEIEALVQERTKWQQKYQKLQEKNQAQRETIASLEQQLQIIMELQHDNAKLQQREGRHSSSSSSHKQQQSNDHQTPTTSSHRHHQHHNHNEAPPPPPPPPPPQTSASSSKSKYKYKQQLLEQSAKTSSKTTNSIASNSNHQTKSSSSSSSKKNKKKQLQVSIKTSSSDDIYYEGPKSKSFAQHPFHRPPSFKHMPSTTRSLRQATSLSTPHNRQSSSSPLRASRTRSSIKHGTTSMQRCPSTRSYKGINHPPALVGSKSRSSSSHPSPTAHHRPSKASQQHRESYNSKTHEHFQHPGLRHHSSSSKQQFML
jgi:hypothetical protein